MYYMANQYTKSKGVGGPTTIRFTKKQIEVIAKIEYKHPREVRSFSDGLRAVIARPEWLTPKEIDAAVAAFGEFSRGDLEEGKAKTVRFEPLQHQLINEIREKFPEEAKSFVHGMRALITRPKWLTKKELAAMNAACRAS
jgi:hypothetical protein